MVNYSISSLRTRNVVLRIMNQCHSKTDHVTLCGSVTYISWSIDFALYHCHRFKLSFIIKTKWRRPRDGGGCIRGPPGTCSF